MANTYQSTAHGEYFRRAKLRFELEGRAERIRQQRAHMLFFEAIGVHTMSGQLQDMLARERTHQTALEAALG